MLDIAYVLIEFWIDGHVFGANSEALPMLVLILDVQNEGNASWILCHHFFQETHCQVNTLDNQRLVPLVKGIDHLCKFFRHQRALLLVALQSYPTL